LARAATELEIAPAPAASPMIRGTGARGNSGGMRIICHLVTRRGAVLLLGACANLDKENPADAETRETCKLIATLKAQG
jgi:hypothetical protein